MNGDDHISSFETRLWAIHQELIVNRGCYTVFRWIRQNVPAGTPGLVLWMVPRYHDECFEIIQWLEHELESEVQPPTQFEDVTFPGQEVKVIVTEFSGIDPYIDRDTSERLAAEMAKKFIGRIKQLQIETKNDEAS